MKELFKAVGLLHVEAGLPALLQQAQSQQLTYEAFLQEVLITEKDARQQLAYQRRLRLARLPTSKTLEAFDFSFQPGLSQRLVQELATLSFLATSTNVVLLGPPGVGKTHLVSALAVKAVQAGHSALFTSLSRLVDDLAAVPHPSLWRQRLRRYIHPEVLVIDEVGYTRLTPEQAHHLFELVTARYERGSILLTSNTSFAEWGNLLGDEILATALLDRLLHHAEVLAINGNSYRMKDRLPPGTSFSQPGGVRQEV
jgi:DNA replication protein DnaC